MSEPWSKAGNDVPVVWSECGNYWFDEEAADGAVEFFNTRLHFIDAEWAGKPFKLEPFQEHDIVRPAWGWKRKDGTRRYRRVYVWIPRKNGKTTLAAGCGLLMLVGDGEPGGQVYSIAANEDQAKIVFDIASVMVGMSESLSSDLTCFKPSIYCPALAASFKPLSGKAQGKHGLNMSGLVGDEIHEWKDGKLYTYVHQSVAARRQPLEVLISTAGERAGYGFEEWKYCQGILAGEIDDPETLVVVYAADPEDDWTDPEVWAKANPNLGVSVKMSFLEAECRKAMELPRLENDFKRYHLNMWTEQAVRWLPLDKWDACGHPILTAADEGKAPSIIAAKNERWRDLPDQMIGRQATAGVDLSATTDLTCFVWVFAPLNPGGLWVLVPRFFVPEVKIEERSKRDKVPYERWRDMGALTATEGDVVDYEFVKASLFEDAERFDPGLIAIDRWNAMQFMQELQTEELKPHRFGQGFGSMSEPSKRLERLVLKRQIDHGGHPVLRWCAGNVAVRTDPAGNIKPDKEKSTERIDGIVATIMGLGAAVGEVEDEESVYEKLAEQRRKAETGEPQESVVEAPAGAGASQEIDYVALNDVNHPDFEVMKERFEQLMAERDEEDEEGW